MQWKISKLNWWIPGKGVIILGVGLVEGWTGQTKLMMLNSNAMFLNLIAASTQFPVSSVSLPVYGGKNKQNCFYNNLLDGLLLTLIVK